MSKIIEAFKKDFLATTCSSSRRILKIVAICFVPFVYAFICMAALWNPLGNIGKVPMAIVSLDNGYNEEGNQVYLLDDLMSQWKNNEWNSLGLFYNENTDRYCAKITDTITFTNMQYFSSHLGDDTSKLMTFDANNKTWDVKSSKYYMEVGIPTFFSQYASVPEDNEKLDGTICNYIAYERNYVSCEVLDMGSQFVVGIVLERVIDDLLIPDVLPSLPNFDKWMFHDVPNKKFAIYGVGIGELFLSVGMWVGAFAFSLIYDRKKRVQNINSTKWYFSKWLMMAFVSLCQSFIVMMAVGCLGLFGLGASFLLEWMLVIFGGLVFSTIIQALWFSFRDKSVSNFFMILFLVLNIACGFGTFPSILQFPIFHWLSYIMPFTYMMHAQGALIFNIAVGVNTLSSSLYILQCCATLLIYPAIFFSLGCFVAKKREREIYYGSANKKDVLDSLKKLNIHEKYLNKRKQLSWKKLPKHQMSNVCELTLKNHPYEKKFTWWKKKHDNFLEEDLSKISD